MAPTSAPLTTQPMGAVSVTTSTCGPVSAGATTISLCDVSGLSTGMSLTLSNDANSETKAIMSIYRRLSDDRRPLAVAGSIIVDTPLEFSYAAGATVTATTETPTTTSAPALMIAPVPGHAVDESIGDFVIVAIVAGVSGAGVLVLIFALMWRNRQHGSVQGRNRQRGSVQGSQMVDQSKPAERTESPAPTLLASSSESLTPKVMNLKIDELPAMDLESGEHSFESSLEAKHDVPSKHESFSYKESQQMVVDEHPEERPELLDSQSAKTMIDVHTANANQAEWQHKCFELTIASV